MTPLDLGFTAFFADQVGDDRKGVLARVTRVSGLTCHLRCLPKAPFAKAAPEPTEEVIARIPKRVRKGPLGMPVVGDWLLVDLDGDEPSVHRILDRSSHVRRRAPGHHDTVQVIVANVDVVWIVTGLDGDFNLRRLERYLTVVADSGALPVILLTKAGICDDVPNKVAEAKSVAGDAAVHAIDVLAGINASALDAYLKAGDTIGLLGSSGAGKSTLTNYLVSSNVMATGAVREGDNRGRHTTTHRKLFWLPSGVAIIDNPGMRELQLWVEHDALNSAFPEVDQHAASCKFSDCTHEQEPGCAVREAVASGGIEPRRFQSYQNLHQEITNGAAQRTEHERRATERELAQTTRNAQRTKRKKKRR